jgi:hypothetical protein
VNVGILLVHLQQVLGCLDGFLDLALGLQQVQLIYPVRNAIAVFYGFTAQWAEVVFGCQFLSALFASIGHFFPCRGFRFPTFIVMISCHFSLQASFFVRIVSAKGEIVNSLKYISNFKYGTLIYFFLKIVYIKGPFK